MNKDEIFDYLDERLGENTPAVISIKTYIQIKVEMLEKIKNFIEEDKNCIPRHIKDYVLRVIDEMPEE